MTITIPMPSSRMKKYGISADTMNRRRWIATRWWKITDIAFSSTVNARALEKIIVMRSTPPTTRSWSRKTARSLTSARGLAGHHELQIRGDGLQQPSLVDDMRQGDQDQDQQRDEREERVVRHGAGEEQALVRTESLEHAEHERARMLQDGGMVARSAFRHDGEIAAPPTE